MSEKEQQASAALAQAEQAKKDEEEARKKAEKTKGENPLSEASDEEIDDALSGLGE